MKIIFHRMYRRTNIESFHQTKYPIEIIDLRNPADDITPKKNKLFQEHRGDPDNARMILILITRREIELISDGNKLIEVRVI